MLEESGEHIPVNYHRRFVYNRREPEANSRRNFKQIVRYCTGVQTGDHSRCFEGDFNYATFAVFAGEYACKNEPYAIPKTAATSQ